MVGRRIHDDGRNSTGFFGFLEILNAIPISRGRSSRVEQVGRRSPHPQVHRSGVKRVVTPSWICRNLAKLNVGALLVWCIPDASRLCQLQEELTGCVPACGVARGSRA